MMQGRTRAVAIGFWAGLGGVASADTIVVPGDVETFEEAVAIAEPGDTIIARTFILENVDLTGLGGKALTVRAGTPGNPNDFVTGNASHWRLPDGARLEGEGFFAGGSVSVRSFANAALVSDRSLEFGGGPVTLEDGARLGVLIPPGEDSLFARTVLLGRNARLEFEEADADTPAVFEDLVLLEPGSRLRIGALRLEREAVILAADAEVHADLIEFSPDEGSIQMDGGELRFGSLELRGGASIQLRETDLVIVDDARGASQVITGAFDMFQGRLESEKKLEIDSRFGPGPVLEQIVLSAPEISFDGAVSASGVWQGPVEIQTRAALTLLGQTVATGPVEHSGHIEVLGGDARFLAGIENRGSIAWLEPVDDEATLEVRGDFHVLSHESIVLPEGARLLVGGSVRIWTEAFGSGELGIRNVDLELLAPDDPGAEQEVEALSSDLGPTPRGFDTDRPDTAPLASLRMQPGADVRIVDQARNQQSGEDEAVYVDGLIIPPGAEVAAEGPRVYYGSLSNQGEIVTPERFIRVGDCAADVAEPYGIADLADAVGFIEAFMDGRPLADYRTPFGTFDLADLGAFVSAFHACGN